MAQLVDPLKLSLDTDCDLSSYGSMSFTLPVQLIHEGKTVQEE